MENETNINLTVIALFCFFGVFILTATLVAFNGKVQATTKRLFRRIGTPIRQGRGSFLTSNDKSKKAIPVPKSLVKVATRNESLVSFRRGTSAIVILGAIALLIGLVNSRNLVASAAFSLISTWLLGIGILGKLLLGAAKVIVDGLGGNIRETDTYEEES